MYELMKKAKSLPRSEKISFLEDLEEMIVLAKTPRKEVLRNMELDAIDDVNSDGSVDEKSPDVPNKKRQDRQMDTKRNPDGKKAPRYIPKNYTHLNQQNSSGSFGHENMASSKDNIKVAKRLYDPETTEELGDLIILLEKNISVDGDLSFDSLSVFLIPLLRGSQRVGLKSQKIVGLMKKLCRLSRKYQRVKQRQMSHKEKHEVRKDFSDCLKEIKSRLNIKSGTRKSVQKVAQVQNANPIHSLRNNILNLKLMGLTSEEAKQQVERISVSLDYDVMSVLDSVISEVY